MTETRTANSNSDDAREAIIGAIRQNLSTSAPFDAEWRKHHGHSSDSFAATTLMRPEMSRDVLIENFRASLESVGGHCTVVATEAEAAEHVKTVIANIGAKRSAVSDSLLVRRIGDHSTGTEIVENAPAEYLFECDLGITSAQWAIAETGTLVLESDKESHRLTSLVPPVHLCVLHAADIRQTMAEILNLVSRDLSRTVTFITGASRTSDIELTLAIGVHGPGELHVIVIAD